MKIEEQLQLMVQSEIDTKLKRDIFWKIFLKNYLDSIFTTSVKS